MDIKNIGEFANYCQAQAGNEALPEIVNFAERWADLSVALKRQYGGHGEGLEEWIDDAYQRMTAEGIITRQDQLTQTHEVLTRFWEHGDAFDKWFRSKVIIVHAQ